MCCGGGGGIVAPAQGQPLCSAHPRRHTHLHKRCFPVHLGLEQCCVAPTAVASVSRAQIMDATQRRPILRAHDATAPLLSAGPTENKCDKRALSRSAHQPAASSLRRSCHVGGTHVAGACRLSLQCCTSAGGVYARAGLPLTGDARRRMKDAANGGVRGARAPGTTAASDGLAPSVHCAGACTVDRHKISPPFLAGTCDTKAAVACAGSKFSPHVQCKKSFGTPGPSSVLGHRSRVPGIAAVAVVARLFNQHTDVTRAGVVPLEQRADVALPGEGLAVPGRTRKLPSARHPRYPTSHQPKRQDGRQ